MTKENNVRVHVPRIEYLRVQNYRALKNLELKDIKPLTCCSSFPTSNKA